MRKPHPAGRGFSEMTRTAVDAVESKLRRKTRKNKLDGLEIARALYGPTIHTVEPEPPVRIAPLTAEPCLSTVKRAEIYYAGRRLEAAVRRELARRGES